MDRCELWARVREKMPNFPRRVQFELTLMPDPVPEECARHFAETELIDQVVAKFRDVLTEIIKEEGVFSP